MVAVRLLDGRDAGLADELTRLHDVAGDTSEFGMLAADPGEPPS